MKPPRKLRTPLPPSSPPRPSSPPLEFPESEEEIVPTSDETELEINPNEVPALRSMHERDLSQLTDPAAKAECERLWNALPKPPPPGHLVEHWCQIDTLIKACSNSASSTSTPTAISPSSRMRNNNREAEYIQRKEKRRAGPNKSTRVLRSQKEKKDTT